MFHSLNKAKEHFGTGWTTLKKHLDNGEKIVLQAEIWVIQSKAREDK